MSALSQRSNSADRRTHGNFPKQSTAPRPTFMNRRNKDSPRPTAQQYSSRSKNSTPKRDLWKRRLFGSEDPFGAQEKPRGSFEENGSGGVDLSGLYWLRISNGGLIWVGMCRGTGSIGAVLTQDLFVDWTFSWNTILHGDRQDRVQGVLEEG